MKVAEGGVEGVMPEVTRLLRRVRAWVSGRDKSEEKGGDGGGDIHICSSRYIMQCSRISYGSCFAEWYVFTSGIEGCMLSDVGVYKQRKLVL